MRIKVSDHILGKIYSFTYRAVDGEGTEYPIQTRILFGCARPKLLWGVGGLVPIDNPSRFGQYDTPSERRQFCEKFAAGDAPYTN